MSILFALSRQPKLFFQLLVTVVRTVPFNLFLSDRRHSLPSAALLRTVRATFTAYGSSLR
ncbi:hypothetical protein C5F64_05940 [Photobacterium damselae subsp. damselae]|nr:hypothetical protein C5F64_05940 [Photobacterium damselae subsp. damselae]